MSSQYPGPGAGNYGPQNPQGPYQGAPGTSGGQGPSPYGQPVSGQTPYGQQPYGQGGHQPAAYPPPGGAWPPMPAIAPKPGTMPLRPLSVGEPIGVALSTIKKQFAVSFWLPLLGYLLPWVLMYGALIFLALSDSLGDSSSSDGSFEYSSSASSSSEPVIHAAGWQTALAVVVLIAGALSMLVLQGTVSAGLTHAWSRAVVGGKSGFGEAFRVGLRRTPTIIVLGLVGFLAMLVMVGLFVGLMVAVGLSIGQDDSGGSAGAAFAIFLLVLFAVGIVMIYFSVRLCLTLPVIVLEGAGPFRALRRSWQLTNNRFWRTLGTLALQYLSVLVVMYALEFIVIFPLGIGLAATMPTSSDAGTEDFSSAIGFVIVMGIALILLLLALTVLQMAFFAYGISSVYADARMRDEGIAPQLIEASAAGRDARWPSTGPVLARR